MYYAPSYIGFSLSNKIWELYCSFRLIYDSSFNVSIFELLFFSPLTISSVLPSSLSSDIYSYIFYYCLIYLCPYHFSSILFCKSSRKPTFFLFYFHSSSSRSFYCCKIFSSILCFIFSCISFFSLNLMNVDFHPWDL